ncbi:hypothetical protein chiPu_0003649 [Chiloscyllium punctatum]|uniref:Uncharacterized protein n=1 Tax=Chiloscyllium punctatum TaxID=137246 RepID=A0A401S4D2_CHIPU|nr:hypothetical protein [Chiloscyllium punctatum]
MRPWSLAPAPSPPSPAFWGARPRLQLRRWVAAHLSGSIPRERASGGFACSKAVAAGFSRFIPVQSELKNKTRIVLWFHLKMELMKSKDKTTMDGDEV